MQGLILDGAIEGKSFWGRSQSQYTRQIVEDQRCDWSRIEEKQRAWKIDANTNL